MLRTDDEREAGKLLLEVRFEYSPEFVGVLEELSASLLISTYQAGKLCVVGVREGKLTFAFHEFERVMGVAAGEHRVAVGTRRQVYFLSPAHEFAPRLDPVGVNDACWLVRKSFFTGNIHVHDLAWGSDGLWIVNTLFSCLCTLHEDYNFVPRWRPRFVSQLVDQDRCHLNGLAIESGKPRYVTAFAESDEPAGWRPTKATSGCVVDVVSGETIARGLSMPHSPRVHDGRLWVLDSGRGRLCHIDRLSGRIDTAALLPGYSRGLAFCGRYAFVGLSKIRESAVFGGVPIAEYRDQLRCGVGVIDLESGRTVATLQFHSGVDEMFAVEVLPNVTNPRIYGPLLEEGRDQDVWVVPSGVPPDETTHSLTLAAARSSLGGLVPGQDDRSSQFAVASADRESSVAACDSITPDVESTIPPAARDLAAEGVSLHGQNRPIEALDCLRKAAELAPDSAEIQNHLGNLYQDLGELAVALGCYRRALAIRPNYAPAHQNCGYLCVNLGEPLDGLKHFESAQRAQQNPMNLVLASLVLPVIYESVNDVHTWRKRMKSRVQALLDSGLRIETRDKLVPTTFFIAYQGENDRELMRDIAQVYSGVACCPPAMNSAWRPAGPRIKVGFLSAHFRDHTIGRLNLGCIQRLDRKAFEVTVISLGRSSDSMAEQFRQAADRFVEVRRQVTVARQQIAELKLDVLIFADVGMDALTQTLAYSRMAPIQCASWGHPDTTGSPTIDYFLSSELLETASGDDHYTEKLVRLPNLGIRYSRPVRSGTSRGREFFGLSSSSNLYMCPQTLFKFHPEFDEVLAKILAADPRGELVVLEGRIENWTRRLRQRWSRTLPEGGQRVRFVPSQPNPDFLNLLATADVILDPFPFGGGNTTYEALAVASPVVTFPGPYLRSRIASALYRRMGVTCGIAESPTAYAELAVSLGTDKELNRRVREEIAACRDVLFDNDQDVSAVESALQNLVATRI